MPRMLKALLLLVYGGTAANETKDKHRKTIIKVDDRNRNDVYTGFCHIHAIFSGSEDKFTLQLINAPLNQEVQELVQQYGGQFVSPGQGEGIQFSLRARDHQMVVNLARVIHRVIRRGQQYSDRNWRWICPRTADSLERLAIQMQTSARSHLSNAQKPHHHTGHTTTAP